MEVYSIIDIVPIYFFVIFFYWFIILGGKGHKVIPNNGIISFMISAASTRLIDVRYHPLDRILCTIVLFILFHIVVEILTSQKNFIIKLRNVFNLHDLYASSFQRFRDRVNNPKYTHECITIHPVYGTNEIPYNFLDNCENGATLTTSGDEKTQVLFIPQTNIAAFRSVTIKENHDKF